MPDDTGDAPPYLSYPIDLPWSAIFFPLRFSLQGGGAGHTQVHVHGGPCLSRSWWEEGIAVLLFSDLCWKRAHPALYLHAYEMLSTSVLLLILTTM